MTRPDIPAACMSLAIAILAIVVICGCIASALDLIDRMIAAN